MAHIGVLAGLEMNGIFPDAIIGTSAGAIIGVLYAAGYGPDEILQIAKESNLNRIFRPAMSLQGWSNQKHLEEQLKKYVAIEKIEDLPKTFYLGLTNLNTGKHEVWNEGPLYRAVMASAAVPGVFQTVEIDGSLYLDGGVMHNMPAENIRSECDFLFGSNVVTKDIKTNKDLGNIRSILSRVFEISLWYRSRLDEDHCDVVIEPAGLNAYHVFNFSKAEEMYQLGLHSTLAQIDQILEQLDALPAHSGRD